MFGKNPIRSISNDSGNLAVESIFYTIQGEGPFSGCPALFIRLAGCNLACTFCDTEFETQADSPRPIEHVLAEVMSFPLAQRRLVVLTGGEPLRQNINRLCELLLASGTQIIQLETAGTLWQAGMERMINSGHMVLVCSPKTPGLNPWIMQFCKHWKYVLKANELSQDDGLPNRGTQPGNADRGQRIYRPWGSALTPTWTGGQIWVSPCDEYDADKNAANMHAARDVSLKFGYRLSLQVHKIIGVA